MSLEQSLLNLIGRSYRVIVIVFLAMAIACAGLIDFKVENSIKSWVDTDSEGYQQYQRFITEFGDDATLLAVYSYADLTSVNLDEYLSFIEQIKKNNAVSAVFDPVDMFLLNPDGSSLNTSIVDDLKTSFKQRPPDFRNVLMSKDMTTLGILILLSQDHEQTHPEIVHEVEQHLSNMGLHSRFAGTSYFSDTLSQSLTHDLTLVITGLITMSILILLWFFRSPVVVVCVIAGIGISLLYTLVFTSVLQIKFNLLTLILYPLVFCIGITTSIHLFSRRDEGIWKFESAYKKIFKPTLITMITTIIGCGAFIFAPQTIVRDMGFVFPVAISITYFVMLIFVPSAYLMLAKHRRLLPLPISSIAGLSARKNIIVSFFLFIIAIVAVSQLSKLRTEPDAIYFFPPDAELIQSYKVIEEKLTGLMVVDMMVETVDGTLITTEKNTTNVKYFLGEARQLAELTDIVSPLDWLNTYKEEIITPELKQAYLSNDKKSMRITFRFKNISDVPFEDTINKLQGLWDKHKAPALMMHISGLLPMILEAQDALLKTQALVFPVILVLMTVVLFLIFPSPGVLLSACLANILPLIIMAGAMALFEIPVNSINLFVASVMLGVIVDDTIHLLYAWNKTDSIEHAMSEVKPALLITTLTIVLAFSSLLFSSLRPVSQFGLLSIVAVIVAYLCDVYLLPLLLNRIKVQA